MGHNTGLKESYNRAQEETLLTGYLKAVPELIILEKIDVRNEDVESLKEKNATLEQRVAELEADKKNNSVTVAKCNGRYARSRLNGSQLR